MGASRGPATARSPGRLHDSGPTADYRTQTPETIFIRRVITGAKGTITFVIKIPTAGAVGEPWTITSGTGTYAKLQGRGYQVVDNYTGTPATFVLTGTVSQVKSVCPASDLGAHPGSDLFCIRSPPRPGPHAPSQVVTRIVLSESDRHAPWWTASSGTDRARPSAP